MEPPKSDWCANCDKQILLYDDDTQWVHAHSLWPDCIGGEAIWATPSTYIIQEEAL